MSTFIDLDSIWRDRKMFPNPCDYQLTPDQVDTWSKSATATRAIAQPVSERTLEFVTAISVVSLTLPFPRIELYAPYLITAISINTNVITVHDPHGLETGDIVMTSSTGYHHGVGIQRNVEYHVIVVSDTSFSIELIPGSGAISLTNRTGLDLELAVIDNPAAPSSNYQRVINEWRAGLKLLEFPRLYLDFHSYRYNDSRSLKTIKGVLANAKFVLLIDKTQFDENLSPKWIHYRACGEQVMRFKRDEPVVLQLMSRDGTVIPFFTESDLMVASNPDKQTMLTVNCQPYLKDLVTVNQTSML